MDLFIALDHPLIYFTNIYLILMLFSPTVIRQGLVFLQLHFHGSL